MATDASQPKASSYQAHRLRSLAAEPAAAVTKHPVAARLRSGEESPASKPQSQIAALAAPRIPPMPRAEVRSPRSFASQDERAAEEATLVDAGLAERIAAESAREQRIAIQRTPHTAPTKARASRLGEYRLLRLLASGQTSDVHLARPQEAAAFARHLAIKTLRHEHRNDAQRVLAFVENARLFSALHHEHFARVLDAGIHDGTHYVVMDYLHGMSLRTALQHSPGGLPLDFAITAIASSAEALHHARSRQPHHANLRLGIAPSYVMACQDGAIKLCRLGNKGISSPTAANGEFAYLAPEHARGEAGDARSEVFALGVMLYELLTGVHPYLDPTEPAFATDRDRLLHAKVEPPIKYMPHLASELCVVVMTAMARQPDDRYRDCHEFGQTLLDAAERVAVRAGPAAVRQLVNHLLGTSEVTNVRVIVDSNEIASVRVIEPASKAASIAPVTSPAPSTPAPPSTSPWIARPATVAPIGAQDPTAHPATALPQGHEVARSQPPGRGTSPRPAPTPTPPVRPAARPAAQADVSNRYRSVRAAAVATNPCDPQREPRRAFQALVLLGGAAVVVAGVTLALSIQHVTAEPTLSATPPHRARKPEPTSIEPAATVLPASAPPSELPPDPPAYQDQPSEQPPDPPAYQDQPSEQPPDPSAYQDPPPDLSAYQDPPPDLSAYQDPPPDLSAYQDPPTSPPDPPAYQQPPDQSAYQPRE
jgi:eukaryotic-like serine/threonine-protein kinase